MDDTAHVRLLDRSRPSAKRTVVVVALAATLLSARSVHAQSERDAAVRIELLQQAQEARGRGYHARALDLAQRAGAISMTPSVRLFLAEENHSLGRLAEAYAEAQLCERAANRDEALRNRAAILTSCHDLAQALRPQLGNVIVHVPDTNAPGLRVVVAGSEVNRAFLGVPFFVTPGNVPVDVTANGQPSFHAVVQVAAGRDVEVPVTYGANIAAHVEPIHTEPTHPTHTEPTHTEPTHTEPTHTEPRRVEPTQTPGENVAPPQTTTPRQGGVPGPAVALIGIGAAGVIAGGVFLVVRQLAVSTINNDCTPPDMMNQAHCYPGTDAEVNSATSRVRWTNIATPVSFAVGGAALIGGIAWWLVAGRGSHEHARWHVAPSLAGVGVVVGGEL
jgi:hypothetical protein